jgi:hypothetical protein
MPITVAEVIRASARMLKISSIPLREPSSARPTFWSQTICETRTRPVPPASGWLDYIVLQPGKGDAPAGYSGIINFMVTTAQTNMATNGLLYRFVLLGNLMPAQMFNLSPGFDLNVERVGTPNPFPAQPRRVFIIIDNNSRLVLQVNNTSGIPVNAYAALYGWWYPNLGTSERSAFEASGFIQTDAARGAEAGTGFNAHEDRPPYEPVYPTPSGRNVALPPNLLPEAGGGNGPGMVM